MDKVVSSLKEGKEGRDNKDSPAKKQDKLFDPTIDMLVNDFDDERTLEEEEALAAGEAQDPAAELSNLQKESNMPIEELLALYGYQDENQENESPDEDGEDEVGSTVGSEGMDDQDAEIMPPTSSLRVLYQPIPDNDQDDSRLLRYEGLIPNKKLKLDMAFLDETTIADVIGVRKLNENDAGCHNTNEDPPVAAVPAKESVTERLDAIKPVKLEMEIVGLFMIPVESDDDVSSYDWPEKDSSQNAPGVQDKQSENEGESDESTELDMGFLRNTCIADVIGIKMDMDFLNHTSIEEVIGVHVRRADDQRRENEDNHAHEELNMHFLDEMSIEEVIGVNANQNQNQNCANLDK